MASTIIRDHFVYAPSQLMGDVLSLNGWVQTQNDFYIDQISVNSAENIIDLFKQFWYGSQKFLTKLT